MFLCGKYSILQESWVCGSERNQLSELIDLFSKKTDLNWNWRVIGNIFTLAESEVKPRKWCQNPKTLLVWIFYEEAHCSGNDFSETMYWVLIWIMNEMEEMKKNGIRLHWNCFTIWFYFTWIAEHRKCVDSVLSRMYI